MESFWRPLALFVLTLSNERADGGTESEETSRLAVMLTESCVI